LMGLIKQGLSPAQSNGSSQGLHQGEGIEQWTYDSWHFCAPMWSQKLDKKWSWWVMVKTPQRSH
jgi:hypothetical protein